MEDISKKIPLLENSSVGISEETLAIPNKGKFVTTISAENNYVILHMIPDSKMLDSIEAGGKDEFVDGAVKFLSDKFGVDFAEKTGPHAGYMFKFHVRELIKGMDGII